jgi:hypothetical protein
VEIEMKQIGEAVKKVHRTLAREAICKIDHSKTIEQQVLMFHEKLITIIRPRSQSDRTGFGRISNWLLRRIQDKVFQPEVLEMVLRFAQEAAGPDCRNPAAVFMSIMKKELGYGRS